MAETFRVDTQRYIVLPKRGLRATTAEERNILGQIPNARSTDAPLSFRIDALAVDADVVDTVSEDGPKLVDIDPATAARLNRADSPVRAFKEVFYLRPEPEVRRLRHVAQTSAGSTFEVEVIDQSTRAPLRDCYVVAFSNYQNREGVEGRTNANGRVRMQLPGARIDCAIALPEPGSGYWSGYRRSVAAMGTVRIEVPPVVVPFVDCVRHYYGATNFVPATGVVVGVVDTGCGPHADLNIVGGRNTVTGEPALDIEDGHYHGTHVAGLVGARGTAASGIRGVAPGIPIRSYRVFGANSDSASNYAILKAMILAAEDKCDILNLSLGGGPEDEIVRESIIDARNQGMLVVIAAGNDGRQGVSYPAAYPGAIAVSAMGREGTVPRGSSEELKVLRPPGSSVDAHEFIADFSNVGPEIHVTGPGVGTLSTLPHDRIGPLSGTSMAAPVIAGAAACLLSQQAAVHGMRRQRGRSDAIERLLQTNCGRRGFGLTFEGFGMPQSPVV